MKTQKKKNYIGDTYLFIDSDKDAFIVGEDGTIIRLGSTFPEYHYEEDGTIEGFLDEYFNTTLVKAYCSTDDFDIDITLR